MSLSWGMFAELRDLWVPPSLRRRLGLALSFVGFGLIAGTSGLTLIVADNDSDPRSAFAFAPLEPPSVATAAPTASAKVPVVDAVLPGEVTEPDRIARKIANRGTAGPVPDAPASATPPTAGDTHGPVVAESHPAASVENPPALAASAPQSTDVVPAVVEATAPAAESAPQDPSAVKPQKTARQQTGRRHGYQQSSARRGRYAQQHFWPFW